MESISAYLEQKGYFVENDNKFSDQEIQDYINTIDPEVIQVVLQEDLQKVIQNGPIPV